MGYNAIDILDKAILITENKKKMYRKIASNSNSPRIQLVADILISHLDKSIYFYKFSIVRLRDKSLEEIPFDVYDTVSSLVNTFGQLISIPDIKEVRDFMKFASLIESKTLALFVDIQGRVLKNREDVNSEVYKILGILIKEKQKNIEDINSFLR